MTIRGKTICPFNVLNASGSPTYCDRGRPSLDPYNVGVDICDAYVYVDADLCRTDHCKVRIEVGASKEGVKEVYEGLLCEDGACPYEGCQRLRDIKPMPLVEILKWKFQNGGENGT